MGETNTLSNPLERFFSAVPIVKPTRAGSIATRIQVSADARLSAAHGAPASTKVIIERARGRYRVNVAWSGRAGKFRQVDAECATLREIESEFLGVYPYQWERHDV